MHRRDLTVATKWRLPQRRQAFAAELHIWFYFHAASLKTTEKSGLLDPSRRQNRSAVLIRRLRFP